ncbi:MAG TPA: ATP-binding protein [Ideonella sp.]|nr:ATP-binding protein [Ideonella sp.]
MRFPLPMLPQGAKAAVNVRALLVWGAVALLLIAAAAAAGHGIAMRAEQRSLKEAAQHRLDMIAAGLDGDLARFDYLPSLLEMTPNVQKLLSAPAEPVLRDEVNRYLSGINATAGAEMLYVLDRDGVALAAADWDLPSTTVGAHLGFRPYVQDALRQGRGRFFGVGITSGRPGYYLSYALSSGGQARGVATVKVSLAGAERAWATLPGEVLLLDERGVVILATREHWKFRPLTPLAADTRAEIARTRPYGNAELQPLDWRELEPLDDDARIVSLAGVAQLASLRRVNSARWRLIVLDDLAPARHAARNVAAIAALASSVALLLLLVAWQRRRAQQALRANQAALQIAHDTLESRVVERTAALRRAQNDLVHAEKMAALGQMSAGLVHELNQPLAAMRTLSDNARVLLDQHRDDEARGNLLRIGRLVERLGKLTRQLKVFSRKSGTAAAPVALRAMIASALSLHADRIGELGVAVELGIAPPSIRVAGDEAQLEQVFVNLIGNAVDAMSEAPVRRLLIEGRVQGERCTVTLTDTGPGIRADILPQLFQPFVTSKPAGTGLGLGLLISANIVREAGGSLAGSNAAAGGACFAVELLLATSLEPIEHE